MVEPFGYHTNLGGVIASRAWPNALKFVSAIDSRLWTTSPTVDFSSGGIRPFTSLNYDGDPFTAPHTFTILLPPAFAVGKGRLFFIYVDHYISGDLLAFQTAGGTTDTVNGNLFGKTLTLTGPKKHLFMCVCIGGQHYLVSPFGDADQLNPNQYGYNAIPTRVWNGRLTPTNTSFQNTSIVLETGTTTTFMNANTVVGYLDVIPGLSNAFSYAAIPTQGGIYGFLCNEGGWYRFSMNTRLVGTGAVNLGFCALVTFTGAGTILRSGASVNQVVIASSVKNSNMNVAGTITQHFVAGYYYSFGITGNFTAIELLGDGGASDPVQNIHTYTFTLIKKDNVTSFSSFNLESKMSDGVAVESLESVLIGDPKLKTAESRKKLLGEISDKKQQREADMMRKIEEEERRRDSKKRKKAKVDAEFEVHSELSLTDVEGIVKRMLYQNQQDLTPTPPPPPPPTPCPPLPDSSTKKRKRVMVGASVECGEKELL